MERSFFPSRLGLPRTASLLVLVLLPGSIGRAQSGSTEPTTFEVASIRAVETQQSGGEGSSRSQIIDAADGLTMRNVDLREMVRWAYRLEDYQVLGRSELGDRRFDLRAKTADKVNADQLRLMLQDLLATRFRLKLHRQQKREAVYQLVVAKGGPRLPADKTDTLPAAYARESLPRVVDGGFVFLNTTLPEFAAKLSELRGIDLPVVDRTGISGVYDITLKGAASALLQPDGPSLLTLIREQLGLSLVSAKGPVEVVIIDHAEEPAPN
jgi:uncharacterized protein (TIGR03435 family)